MEHPGVLIFIILVLVFVATGLFLLDQLMVAPARLFESVFPAKRPRVDLFGRPNQEQSDALVIYVFSRAFALSFVGLVVMWGWGALVRGT